MPANQTLTITAPRTGGNFMTQVKDHVEALWKTATLRAYGVGGTAGAITASVAPDFSALAAGMSFIIIFPFAPVANAQMNISATGFKPITRADGPRIVAGDVQAGAALVYYDGATYRVLASAGVPAAGGVKAPQITVTRTSKMPKAIGWMAAASYFGGTGAGTWRLMSKTPAKGLGYVDSIICEIVRVR